MTKVRRYRLTTNQSDAGSRVDAWLAKKLPEYSRQQLSHSIKSGKVLISGKPVKPSDKVKPYQTILVEVGLLANQLEPEPIDLEIIHQDKDLAVINKPAGIVMHPAGRHIGGTLANALKHHFKEFYLVHRLDKDTSGVVLVALNQPTKLFLTRAFANRQIHKTYLTLVQGKVTPTKARLNLPIQRGRTGKFEVLAQGRSATSQYSVKEYFKGYSLVEVHPESGRTHQIRVHFKALGYPVVGDAMYGVSSSWLSRQFLHAAQIEFTDWNNHHRKFSAPLPSDLKTVLNDIKK